MQICKILRDPNSGELCVNVSGLGSGRLRPQYRCSAGHWSRRHGPLHCVWRVRSRHISHLVGSDLISPRTRPCCEGSKVLKLLSYRLPQRQTSCMGHSREHDPSAGRWPGRDGTLNGFWRVPTDVLSVLWLQSVFMPLQPAHDQI